MNNALARYKPVIYTESRAKKCQEFDSPTGYLRAHCIVLLYIPYSTSIYTVGMYVLTTVYTRTYSCNRYVVQ